MSLKKQSLIALLLISIGSSIFSMDGYRPESDFLTRAKTSAREFSDKYLGKGNFFRESQEEREQRERRERNSNAPKANITIDYKPEVISLPSEVKLSDNAVAALKDLKKNVIDEILANKSMRNEMGLLLPHEQLSRIISDITTSKKITADQATELANLKKGVMRNLEDPDIFNKLVKSSKVYSQEEYNRKVRAYHEVFDNLSNVVRDLNLSDDELKSLKPITELLSERFDNPEDLRKSVDTALSNFKISTTIGEDLANIGLLIGTVLACIVATVVIVACLLVIFDGKSSGGSSSNSGSNSSNWDFFWWQAGRSSRTTNYYTNYYTPDSSTSKPASADQSQRQNQRTDTRREQSNTPRKKIFGGLKATNFNNMSRQV
jgi:hypothetical protein